jgi:hypothetical protein
MALLLGEAACGSDGDGAAGPGSSAVAAALDPGDRDFEFGASFRLDEESSGSEADGGDNLLQRGTFASPGQLKLQLDHRVPSCAGSSGPTGRPSWRWRRQSIRMSGTRSPVGATAARCGSP